MSEEGLLEDGIWDYKSTRKPKSKSQNAEETAQSSKTTNIAECETRRSVRKNTKIAVTRKKNMDKAKNSTLEQKQQRITGLTPEKSIDKPVNDHVVSTQNARSPARQTAKKESPRIPRPVYEGHCPNCQMPFSVLLVQTPRWHVDECLDAPECAEKECPDGLLCSSTIPSHYRRYTHFQLARSRAGTVPATDEPNSRDTTHNYLLPAAAGSLDGGTTDWTQPSENTQKPQPSADSEDISYSPLCSDEEETAEKVQHLRKRLFYTHPSDEDCSEAEAGCSTRSSRQQGIANGYHGAKQPECINRGTQETPFSQTSHRVAARTCPPSLPSERVTIKEEADWTGFSSPVSDEGDWDTQGPDTASQLLSDLPSSASFLPPKEMPVQTRASSGAFREQRGSFGVKQEESSSPVGFGGAFAVSEPVCVKEEFVPLTPSRESPRIFSSPKNKVPSVCVPAVSAAAVLSKALKQTDIGVFFGLKPKAKDEKVPGRSLSQNAPGSPAAGATHESWRGQKKRKAGGSVGDSDPLLGLPQTNGGRAKPPGGGQQGGWPKRFRESDAIEGEKGKKQCPFYKKIPGTGFTVDAFQYGKIEGCTSYFLTHFHSDHYGGLTKKFQFPIYCSKITGNLVKAKLRVEERFINTLPMDTECVVDGIKVVLLEANHCPGAVLLLFCLPNGTAILHTGDFRADASMEQYPALIGRKIHTLYLDTTYCSPEYTFPPQQEAIQFAVTTAFEMVTQNPRTLVVCGTYSVGKEKVFLAVADVLGCKVCMSQDKYKTMQCLESKDIASQITTDWNSTSLHVLPMMQVNCKGLLSHLNKFSGRYDRVLAFKPTGWTYSERCDSVADIKPTIRGKITMYGIPYSEHSSYLEMKRFVQWLRPQKIIPTVNMGNWKARTTMEKFFSQWMTEPAPRRAPHS
ncbi:DNA cross-link repair 1A protein [Lissotriton helveticus]